MPGPDSASNIFHHIPLLASQTCRAPEGQGPGSPHPRQEGPSYPEGWPALGCQAAKPGAAAGGRRLRTRPACWCSPRAPASCSVGCASGSPGCALGRGRDPRRGARGSRWAGPGLAGAQVKGARRRALPSGRCSPRVQRRVCCGSCRAGRPSPGSLWSSRPGAGDGLDGGGPSGGEPLLPGYAWAEDGAPSGTARAGQWGKVIGRRHTQEDREGCRRNDGEPLLWALAESLFLVFLFFFFSKRAIPGTDFWLIFQHPPPQRVLQNCPPPLPNGPKRKIVFPLPASFSGLCQTFDYFFPSSFESETLNV